MSEITNVSTVRDSVEITRYAKGVGVFVSASTPEEAYEKFIKTLDLIQGITGYDEGTDTVMQHRSSRPYRR